MSTDASTPDEGPEPMDDRQPDAQSPQPAGEACPSTTRINPPLDPTKLGVKFSGSPSEGHRITMPEGALETIFGTDEPFQATALLTQCVKVLSPVELGGAEGGAGDERNFMVSIIKDLAPRDAVERMLAVQMAATHVALIRAGASLARATQIPQLEANSTNFNKLARTFATQVEALRKHRNGGRQRVTVEHVHVHPGGQAIVGDVHHGGEGGRE